MTMFSSAGKTFRLWSHAHNLLRLLCLFMVMCHLETVVSAYSNVLPCL